MDPVILAAIITALGGILSEIAGKILDLKLKTAQSNTKKEKNWSGKISFILLGIAIGLVIGSYFPPSDDISSETPPSTEIVESTSTVSTESTPTNTAEPKREMPYVLLGTTKKFGQYEQNNQDWDGPEDIEWLVLKQENNEVLIISVLGLELRPYAQGKDNSDWENSSIRGWLNGTFYHTAFSDEEKLNILEKEIIQHKNQDNPLCAQGNSTRDHVFLLSLLEYSEYMYNNGDIEREYLIGTPSTYVAKKRNVDLSNDKYSWWWLRTSAKDNSTACRVTAYGVMDSGLKDINTDNGMIRPAMWVDAIWWNELQ